MLSLHDVTKEFGSTKVLDQISLSIGPGEFVCITGPSGAGKTSLLHILAGADKPSRGTVEVDGVNIASVPAPALQLFRRRVGIVFQDYKLLPHLTVAENIAFPLEVCGVAENAIRARTQELLTSMNLTAQAGMLPTRISGGEKARTAIARAIAHKPMILLADEPTGNIDPVQSSAIMTLFKNIHAQGTSVILATHDTGLVDALQTRVIRLDQGRITRDSVGGYTGQTAMAPAQGMATSSHQIFTEEKSAQSTPPQSDSEQKRKVRITAVNGNS